MLGEQYMRDFRPQIFDEKVRDIVVQRSDARPTSQTSQDCAAGRCAGEARLKDPTFISGHQRNKEVQKVCFIRISILAVL